MVFETEDGALIKEGFDRVKKVVQWSKENNLDIILDLHKAYGYDFNDAGDEEKNTLFSNEKLQQDL